MAGDAGEAERAMTARDWPVRECDEVAAAEMASAHRVALGPSGRKMLAQAIANAVGEERMRCAIMVLVESNEGMALAACAWDDVTDADMEVVEDLCLRQADGDRPDDMPNDDDIRALVLKGWAR
jgi:hypothetical protein